MPNRACLTRLPSHRFSQTPTIQSCDKERPSKAPARDKSPLYDFRKESPCVGNGVKRFSIPQTVGIVAVLHVTQARARCSDLPD